MTRDDLSQRARAQIQDEAGISMVLVIGMSVVLMLTAILGLSITNAAIDRSGRHVTFEGTAHLAERGVDLALARLQRNDGWSTPVNVTYPVGADAATEEAWALSELKVAPTVVTDEGEYAIVRPSGRQVIYAAGWSPTRDSAQRPRMIKAEYLFSSYSPPGAVLTGGDLKIGGNASVIGDLGDVHSNGDVTDSGGGYLVTGKMTAVGAVPVENDKQAGNQPPKSIPAVNPREIYDLQYMVHDGDITGAGYNGDWYDLCPDGVVRPPASSGPCTSTTALNVAGQEFRGWKYFSTDRTWKYSSSDANDGVYYAYQSGISLSSSPGSAADPWEATLIAEGQAIAPSDCFQSDGDIRIQGRPFMIGKVEGLSLAAGRDLQIQGTGSGDGRYQGLIAAHEQVQIAGNPTLDGAVVAEDACHTADPPPGSPVATNYISGSMIIEYNGGLNTNLVSLIRTTLWLEL